MWPCYSVRDASTMTDDLVPVDPVKFGLVLDNNRPPAPMYLVGYIGCEPVYKTMSTLATGKHTALNFEILIKKSYFI
jgi:hypothetical protein